MFSPYDHTMINKARKLAYWSQVQKQDPALAHYLESLGLDDQIGLKNDLHIEIFPQITPEEISPEARRVMELYDFEGLKRRVFEHIEEYDGAPITCIDHTHDPPEDRSGTLSPTGHRFHFKDLERVSDCFGLYTGHSLPTFLPGCRLSYQQLGHELLETVRDYLFNWRHVRELERLFEVAGCPAPQAIEEEWDEVLDYLMEELIDSYCLTKIGTESLKAALC